MKDLKLSIGIPTFNRAECLRQCLNSIVCQFTNPLISERVEIVISDNNSSDNTALVVAEFQQKFSNIVYKKNVENFGVDRNILQVVEMSGGQYMWLLGDDDALFPGTLEYILKTFEQHPADYYIANCWGYDKSLTKKALNKPNLFITEDKIYNRLGDYIKIMPHNRDLVGLFCGLSVQIFSRTPWMEMQGKEQYIGTNAVHMYTLLTVMKDRKFALLARPSVMVRSDNIRWESFSGLDSLQKRADQTKDALVWALKKYQIKYSPFQLKLSFFWGVLKDKLRMILRTKILRSQKSRDILKKILGKL
jgi:abequosyltransferase